MNGVRLVAIPYDERSAPDEGFNTTHGKVSVIANES